MTQTGMIRTVTVLVVIVFLMVAGAQSAYVVDPGFRGVRVTLGKVSPLFLPEGFGVKWPFITTIHSILVRQQINELTANCYSSDLQQVKTRLRVLYRIPENSVVPLFQHYHGSPFTSLIAPRVQEAIKEITALRSAEIIVQKREEIKTRALEVVHQKIGTLIKIEDLVLEDISLSKELENAIELKMVQEQEANKAKFIQQKTEIEARTAVIRAQGEAESIQIRGEALNRNPAYLELEIVEKWNGKIPAVIGGRARSAGMLLPLREFEKPKP